MKLTKQQQILGGVMLLGLVAVGIDRLAPKAAANTSVADASDISVDPAERERAVTPANAHSNTFNQRLAAATISENATHTAFDIGTAWRTVQPVTVAVDPAADQFAKSHHLSATLARAEHAGAIVDGKLVVVGQSLDGFKLLSITGRSASFANSSARVTLTQIAR